MSAKGDQKSTNGRQSQATQNRGDTPRGSSRQGDKTPRGEPKTPRGRHNKIYRTPPTPPPEQHREMEKGFVLDSNATSSISGDYYRANPKLGPVIPPWNSQRDKNSRAYFGFHGVDKTLDKTGQLEEGGCSIDGPVMDRFHDSGAGYQYLALRNQFGAGHSGETTDGHAQFMQDIKPITGYHGDFGFRRNTPWLRQMPSPFGTASRSPTH